jgi:hypothetical protein
MYQVTAYFSRRGRVIFLETHGFAVFGRREPKSPGWGIRVSSFLEPPIQYGSVTALSSPWLMAKQPLSNRYRFPILPSC